MTSTSDRTMRGGPHATRSPIPSPMTSQARAAVGCHPMPPAPSVARRSPRSSAQAKVSGHLLEAHHVAGKANDKYLTGPLCLNCHAKATALQQRGRRSATREPSSCLEAMALALRSLGTFFEQLAAGLLSLGVTAGPGGCGLRLEQTFPAWRTIAGDAMTRATSPHRPPGMDGTRDQHDQKKGAPQRARREASRRPCSSSIPRPRPTVASRSPSGLALLPVMPTACTASMRASFYADDLAETDPDGLEILRQYVASTRAATERPRLIRLLSRAEFVDKVFYQCGLRGTQPESWGSICRSTCPAWPWV